MTNQADKQDKYSHTKKPMQTISPQETDATSNPPSLKKEPNAPSVKNPSPFPQKKPDAPSVKKPNPFPQKASNPKDSLSVKAHSYWPNEIIPIIKSILSTITPSHKPSLFTFDLSLVAAYKNYFIMRSFDNNLGKALKAQQDSPLGYGSEFQKADVLEPLFHLHPKWERFKNLLNNGSVWPLAEISKVERVKDVEVALTFGNHKGATKQPDLLKLLVNNNLIHGFAFPLPLNKIAQIQGILLAPLNIQAQNTINDTGRIVPKDRLTHDQSYKWSYSGTSVNS
jgi:hypothetical protein